MTTDEHMLEVNERAITACLYSTSLYGLGRGWFVNQKPTRQVQSMLLEKFPQGGHIQIRLPGSNIGVKSYAQSVHPLGTLVRKLMHLEPEVREMILWNVLTYNADFDVGFSKKGKQFIRIQQYNVRSPFWTPQERECLIRIFQLAGLLQCTDKKSFGELEGHKGRSDLVLRSPSRSFYHRVEKTPFFACVTHVNAVRITSS